MEEALKFKDGLEIIARLYTVSNIVYKHIALIAEQQRSFYNFIISKFWGFLQYAIFLNVYFR